MVTPHAAAAAEVPLEQVLGMREDYRREMDAQIAHDSWHARGLTRMYLLTIGGDVAGYGAVGGAPRDAKHTVKEFFVLPHHRGSMLALFRALIAASGAKRIEAQTNDPLLLLMLYDFATDVSSELILFADGSRAELDPPFPGVQFREITAADRESVFEHTHEPVGEWALELEGRIVATGGLAFHYNPPYGDIYMEVDGRHRRQGLGSYLVHRLARLCREIGHRPAARCRQANVASRRALERGGLVPCARIVKGTLVPTGDGDHDGPSGKR